VFTLCENAFALCSARNDRCGLAIRETRFERGGASGRFEARWETGVGLLNEALAFLGLTADSAAGAGRYELAVPKTRAEQRELAEAMREIPGRYAARLSARSVEEITATAAAGQWEKAIDQLIIALHARAEIITAGEREELGGVLKVLGMSAECLEALLVHPDHRTITGGLVTTPAPLQGR
jgi:hypothetical protein